MKTFTSILAVLLVTPAVLSTPVSKEDEDIITVTKDYFPDSLVVYTAKHEIKKITVPCNSLNFDETKEEEVDETLTNLYVFFVEVDEKVNGEEVDQGLYVLKEGKVKKLLEHGRDAAASWDNSKSVFFAAKDGIYTYNARANTAEKYGTLTDNIIGIEKENGTDVIYILTKDSHVYKVTDEGKVKTEVSKVHNAKQIGLDTSNNLYFYNDEKNIFVRNANGVKKIEGLPQHPTSIVLLRPPFIIDDGIPVVIDNKSYIVYANGTSEFGLFEFQVKPTAYSMEPALIQYYAYDKKIYKYDILAVIVGGLLDELKKYLEENKDEVEAISTRLKNGI